MSNTPGEGPAAGASPPTDADRAWTFEAVESVSRTFALSIELLEEPVASWVCTGYLLCRIADTVEDDPSIPPRERADLLETYDAVLDPEDPTDADDFLAAVAPHRPDDGGDDWAVVDRTPRVLAVFGSFDPTVRAAMREVVREMATGMAEFLREYADRGGLRLETVEELEEYCWYVAGTVGKLFSNLLAVHGTDGEADPEDARQFALLLQLVNIAKDVRDDYATENNVYLPGEWLREEGTDHESVADPDSADAVARVVRRVTDRAAGYAPGARRYLDTVPGDAGLLPAAALPYLLALATVRELDGRAREAVTSRGAVKIDRAEVKALYAAADGGLDHEELDRLAAAVREEPYRPPARSETDD
ncbi:squalene/phytoene synthase family protein [Halosegnis marinus]|uniref:Squalene/phytoene synthase family protein n=1 Tax=Halosegnis marinus TaxID=3034023 RepID=A0ABD5ZNM2_9EURY|nr:squalene/phytoene synthase family protein [Halosegnis sp. DT85]